MGSRFALIIGNSQYEDSGLARLVTPSEDARDFSDVLRAPQIGGFDEVIPLLDETASRIQREIARFCASKSSGDLLLLYFSGHGLLDEEGQLYLGARDTERSLLSGTAVPAAFITREMDRSRARQQILILDCCHSGAFAQGMKGPATVGTGEAFRGTGGAGRFVLTATDSTQYAWEGSRPAEGDYCSVFTRHLVHGLRSGEADVNGDGNITPDELYDYIYEHTVQDTPNQTPSKWAFRQQGDIWIARNPSPPRAAQLPPELVEDIESVYPWKREGVLHELERLLNGTHRGLALAAEVALGRLSEDDSRRVAGKACEILNAAVRDGAKTGDRPLCPRAEERLGAEESVPVFEGPLPLAAAQQEVESEPAVAAFRRLPVSLAAMLAVFACGVSAVACRSAMLRIWGPAGAERSNLWAMAGLIVAALLSAYLGERRGKKELLITGLALNCAGLLGFHPGWAYSEFGWVVWVMLGLGQGAVLVAANALMSDVSPRRSSGLNLLNAFAMGGAMISPFQDASIDLLLATEALCVVCVIAAAATRMPGSAPVRTEFHELVRSSRFWLPTAVVTLGGMAVLSLAQTREFQFFSNLSSGPFARLVTEVAAGSAVGCAIAWAVLSKKAPAIVLAPSALLLALAGALVLVNGYLPWQAWILLGVFAGPISPTGLGMAADAFSGSTLAIGLAIACASLAGFVWLSILRAFVATEWSLLTGVLLTATCVAVALVVRAGLRGNGPDDQSLAI